MGYEVVSDDLYDKGKNHDKKSPKKDSKGTKKVSFNPLYIHITILVIILIAVILYFFSNFSFNFSNNEIENINIVGDLDKFNKSYQGDIELYSKQFILETNIGKFDEGSKYFKILGFSGIITKSDNFSIIIKGVAEKIEYGKSVLTLNGKSFKLESFKKTNINLYFKELELNFKEGRIKVGNSLNYEFENSSIILNNYNTTLNYDGMFSFSGPTDKFILKNPTLSKNNIQISYEKSNIETLKTKNE